MAEGGIPKPLALESKILDKPHPRKTRHGH